MERQGKYEFQLLSSRPDWRVIPYKLVDPFSISSLRTRRFIEYLLGLAEKCNLIFSVRILDSGCPHLNEGEVRDDYKSVFNPRGHAFMEANEKMRRRI